MSHLIIKPFDHVFTPLTGNFADTWHGLNEGMENIADKSQIARVLRPIAQVGLKPDMECALSTLAMEENEAVQALADWKLIVADLRENNDDDGNPIGIVPLHVPKKGYAIHQNETLFDSFVAALDMVVGAGNYEIATVGTLGAYSQFFVSVSLKQSEGFTVGKADVHKTFYNLISSHNGLVSSADMLSAVRMVCMNTVQFSITDAEQNGTRRVIKHSKNSEALITPETFASNLEAWLCEMDRLKAFFQAIASVPMSEHEFKAFAAGVFTNAKSDALSTVSYNRISDLSSLFLRGKGNAGKTLGDAINAFTEFFTHGGGVADTASDAKRVANANFGRGNDWKLEAIRVASSEELLAETVKRGTALYGDKLKEQALS